MGMRRSWSLGCIHRMRGEGNSTAPARLIVNADDFGVDVPTNRSILEVYRDGLISSASAMVFMSATQDAVEAVATHPIAIGLHLNLTHEFSGYEVTDELRAVQGRLSKVFSEHLRLHRWCYDPRIQADVEYSLAAQVAEFARVFGSAPAHIDGHRHVHSCLNVLAAR